MIANDLAIVGTWSYGFAAVCFAVFAVRLLFGWRPNARALLFLLASLASALWAGIGTAAMTRPGLDVWLALNFADALRYGLWLLFLATLLRGGESAGSPPVSTRFPKWTVLLVIAGLVACVIVPVPPPAATTTDPVVGIIAFAARLGLAVLGLALVEVLIRRIEPSARWAWKPLCIGLVGVFAYDLVFFADALLFKHLDGTLLVARGAANALVIPFLALTAARNPGLAKGIHVSRGTVYHSTAVIVSGLFLLAVAGAGYIARFIGGEWGTALQIQIVFFALLGGIAIVTSGRFRSRLRVFVSKHFFSYRYDYREEWLRFTRTLAEALSLRDVQTQAIRALAELVESPAGALWIRSEGNVFALAARLNLATQDASEPGDGSLVRFLEGTGWIVDVGEYRANPQHYANLTLPPWLGEVPKAWLVVPLISGTELIGFVVLAESRATIELNWEVRDLLKVASRQAATYLGRVGATEALVEARKFDAFNRMSAFVVHDLKNLVTQLSLMLKNAERHRANPEFQRDMLGTVEHVVGRMNQLMLQLASGETPLGKPRAVKLDAMINSICKARSQPRVEIETELAPGLVAMGHEDRLEHVMGHLIQNAVDAVGERGAVKVRLTRDGESVVVEVADNGVGMTPEFIRERLFKPFETTKASGMGIGVYESSKYVAEIGGKMAYDSKPGAGTSVRLTLPAADGPELRNAKAVA